MNSDEVRRRWADRSGEFSPEYYAYYGPNATSETIR
ncbi:MAG: class I SAM-dependent methyltransferase, partial [Halobaculum sp.]